MVATVNMVFDGICDVCEGGINDGESDGDDGDGESDDDGGGDSDKGRDGDSRSECDGDGDGDVNSGDDDDDDAMESLSRSTPAPQQPCPYRLTTRLKRQYTLLNVPPAPPTPPAARVVNMLRAGVAIKDIQEAYQSQMVHLLLSLMRSLHLYEKKHLEMFQTVTNQSSNAIPDPSAVEGHESADNTHSEMQDEGNSCVSGRRKRRFRWGYQTLLYQQGCPHTQGSIDGDAALTLQIALYVHSPLSKHYIPVEPLALVPTHWDQPPGLMLGSAPSLQADSVIGTIDASTSCTLQVVEPPSLLQMGLPDPALPAGMPTHAGVNRPQTLGPATMAPYPSPTQYNYQLLTAVGITRPTTCETINSLPVKPITPTLQEDLHCQGNHQLLVELPARTGQMGTHP
ncbi:hypothetical protein EMCRGX_G033152 [Ephydatia muelleri]